MLAQPQQGTSRAVLGDELFPSSDRCVFLKAPLAQVICQVRFPPILAVEATLPSTFQDRVRGSLPLLERVMPLALPRLPANLSHLFGPPTSAVQYQFLTEDRQATLQLASDSLTLSTAQYTRWESFSRQFREPLHALLEIYKPTFFVRVGLRYQNAIARSRYGFEDRRWSELLRPEILGELALPQFEASLDGVAQRQLKLRLPGSAATVVIHHGLGYVVSNNTQQSEQSYVLDFDLAKEDKTETADAESTLDTFHHLAGNAFRWAISDTLRSAMEPTSAD
jgi:uncharacterized protein (TIGR04255 family)